MMAALLFVACVVVGLALAQPVIRARRALQRSKA
jgi:hypothetical protein